MQTNVRHSGDRVVPGGFHESETFARVSIALVTCWLHGCCLVEGFRVPRKWMVLKKDRIIYGVQHCYA